LLATPFFEILDEIAQDFFCGIDPYIPPSYIRIYKNGYIHLLPAALPAGRGSLIKH
jgi:hypothetical protein